MYKVKGHKNYNMLLKMAESLALLEHVSQISPKYLDQFRYLLQLVKPSVEFQSLCCRENWKDVTGTAAEQPPDQVSVLYFCSSSGG